MSHRWSDWFVTFLCIEAQQENLRWEGGQPGVAGEWDGRSFNLAFV